MPSKFRRQPDPSVGYLVSGRRLNQTGGELNKVAGERSSGHVEYGADLSIGRLTGAPPPALVIGIIEVTDASNTCAPDTRYRGGTLAPCVTEHLYLGRFRYFSHRDQQWKQYAEDRPIDASAYWETEDTDASQSPASGSGYGAIPRLQRGDVLPGYWDPGRGAYIPIAGIPQDPPSGEWVTDTLEVVTGTDEGAADAVYVETYLEVKHPGGDWLTVGKTSCRVPRTSANRSWVDSRKGFCLFGSQSAADRGTYVRLRCAAGQGINYEVETPRAALRLTGVGRVIGAAPIETAVSSPWPHGIVRDGWAANSATVGRFADSPSFELKSGGVFEIVFLDPIDNWVMCAEWLIEFQNGDDSSSYLG
jgi:hypothetical protein